MIYFIQAETGGPVKIGYAENPEIRLCGLQTANPAKLEIIYKFDGDRTVERAIHRLFAKHHIRGEWYVCAAEIMQFAISIKAGRWWAPLERYREQQFNARMKERHGAKIKKRKWGRD